MTANAPSSTAGSWTDSSGRYANSFAGGSGTENDPYLIATPQQLARLAYLTNTSSTNSQYASLYYEQTSDINVSTYWWTPIGTASYSFSGYYNGGGYTISGIFTQSDGGDYGYRVGLFGIVNGSSSQYAEIHDVGIVDSTILGVGNVGGIAGEARYANIYNCYSYAEIETTSTTAGTGGIVGNLSSSSKLYNCYNAGAITSNGTVGGVIGEENSSTVQNCYNSGGVDGLITGGVIGDSDGYVFNCYNLGYVGGSQNGGVVGYKRGGNLYNCISLGSIYPLNAGAICAQNYATIRNCYWGGSCTLTSGYRGNSGTFTNCGTCTSDNAKDINWYLNSSNWYITTPPSYQQVESYLWDFDNAWTFVEGENNGYPILQMQINNYIISFNANGGQGEMVDLEVVAGDSVVLTANSFTRTGYEFAGWALSSTGAVVYADGANITPSASMTLYAVWRVEVYTITLNWQGGSGATWSTIYFRYGGSNFYSNESCTTMIEASGVLNGASRAGFSFVNFTTNADGSGTVMYQNGAFINISTIVSDDVWYAQWQVNNEAKYDSAGGYWYIENGAIPQTKVTDSTLINALNSATTTGSTYYIAGLTLQARVYNGTEYCQWNGNWYEVEPIKWRLTFSSSQTNGFGTTTDTDAVLAEIVYVGQYSTSSIDAGEGYSSSSVTEFLQNGISTIYLVNYTKSSQTFGDGTSLYNQNLTNHISQMSVSSQSEIISVVGNMNITFSDLAEDLIKYYGGTNVYFTRELGSNYNNIVCFNEVGREVQRFATDYRGVQFTVRFTEYGCVD